ncbi:hypothetical protein HY229_03550 [Candidatus Acetothermia bacterium]|nr:hypothetical protein [Candidatus Acetothermia bacterium]MBI3643159.1 hypothetical protein [Candidatus Acetothermia bacterium]
MDRDFLGKRGLGVLSQIDRIELILCALLDKFITEGTKETKYHGVRQLTGQSSYLVIIADPNGNISPLGYRDDLDDAGWFYDRARIAMYGASVKKTYLNFPEKHNLAKERS